ncbi:MAG TPA: EAL domain-containing protein [Gammaproteobacteria bacterium]
MKILLVEDDSDDAEFLRLSLAQHSNSVTITHKSRIGDAVAALDNERFDVVLLDLNLPDGRGVECVERIHESDELVPIVVLSGQDDEDFAIEILNRGVQDYLVKWEGDGRIILRAIRYAIERKRAEIKVNYLARLDWLTLIPNRQYLRDALAHATTRALRGRRTMALLLLDVDGLKTANDTLGRQTGDALVRAVVQRLKESVREGDLVARVDGHEFAVILEDVQGPLEVEAATRNLGDALQKPFEVGGRQVSLTASIGIAVCPLDSTDPAALLNSAGSAMHEAKGQGRNTLRFFSPRMHEDVLARRQLEADLKVAIEREQFELLYQPQFRLADHRIEAAEALLRWKHPKHGRVGPSAFLDVAEESGHIIPLGRWAIEEVCRQLVRWEGAGVPLPRVAVNVAAAQFRQPGFPDVVRNVLESHSVDPELIELEFTERSLMDDADGARECLHALKDLGVRLAIDYFGAGHSSLSDLRQFPLDVLKIDRSFVSDLDTSQDAQLICSTILTIAHRFSLDAVAEGIESEQQESFLTRNDCQYGQGHYFSRPIEPDQFAAMMIEKGGQATRRRRATRRRIAMKAGREVSK